MPATAQKPDPLAVIKTDLLAGRDANPAALREAEANYRIKHGTAHVPTAKGIVLEDGTLTPEERLALTGPPARVPEGGAGHPVGPLGHYEANAFRTTRPGEHSREIPKGGVVVNPASRRKPPAKKKAAAKSKAKE